MNVIELMKNKLNALDLSQLKEVVSELAKDKREETDLAFSISLDVLEERLSQEDFITFCEQLDI